MSTSLRFVAVGTGQQFVACAELLLSRGHQVVGVVSDCREVSAWSTGRGVPRSLPGQRPAPDQPFDYLLSIVNHTMLSPEFLAAPALGAINYHDSPLPAYAGFNATAWAVLDGRTTHGVTWHQMTADADQGPILVQSLVDIESDDTAFSLGVKCSEAGIATFATLLDQLERGALAPRPQQGERSFHLRSDRPGVALLDFARPAAELSSLVRGLNFGTDDNWMATPKVGVPAGVLSVLEAHVDPTGQGAPGTVMSVSKRALVIAAGAGALAITAFSTADGEALDPVQAAARLGLVEGQRIPALDPAVTGPATELDAVVTKSERFWVQRLATSRPAVLGDLVPHREPKQLKTLRGTWPAALANAPAGRRTAAIIAALAAAVQRLGGGDQLDFAAEGVVPSGLGLFHASVTPFRCEVASAATFRSLIAEVESELARQNTRRTYARDVMLRYRALREQDRTGRSLPIGLRLAGPGTDGLPDSVHLTLVTEAGGGYQWIFDGRAIAEASARQFADRVAALLAAGLADEDAPVHTLPVVLPEERQQLLEGWQQTGKAYESTVCVHQFFEAQVVKTPDAPAVRFGEEEWSYRELNDRANRLAHVLRGLGVGPEALVAICVERSLDLIVGLLGILKAGGAYVPMDPAYPRDRLTMMLEDSKARFLVAQSHLVARLPATDAQIVLVDRLPARQPGDGENPVSGVRPDQLAYVIFTSGSTGRPKGTMLEHRNVANFFAGMDAVVGGDDPKPGVWLAVTSISFDISVLELFWTLARGFTVIIAPESDRASLERRTTRAHPNPKPIGFGLFYFAADPGGSKPGQAYRLLIEGAKFADRHDFAAVWTPERHFHAFGGLYPNPAVTTAALSTITDRIQLRAGSVVLPLHNPLRVAEDWAVIDQLSGGRIGLSFASGWHVNDFAFMPENFERRREIMLENIDTVMKLFRGEKVPVKNGAGQTIEVSVLPRPIQAQPPLWIASAGSADTFILAGKLGANILTNMLGQDLDDLKAKFAAYRAARREHGHEGDGIISVMLHTFVCGDTEEARRLARKPFSDYLASSFDLVKVAPKMFPAFRQPSKSADGDQAFDPSGFTPEDMSALLEHAFDRYFDTAGLFGTPERALEMVDRLMDIGATEMACLIDFGIDPDVVLESLPHLHRLQEMCRERLAPSKAPVADAASDDLGAIIRRHRVTHFQCTPSMARVLASDPESLRSLGQLDRLMLGGEALPRDLAERIAGAVSGKTLNMYGPTETTVWSTTAVVSRDGQPTIGRPIANTTIRILDERRQLVPIGTPGELYIGGEGVARGYLDRPELTADRFVADPWVAGGRLYRTGDLARYRPDGELEFLGRLDHQVKINGHRIELGEIETAIGRHPAVRQAVVVARQNGTAGGSALVAYLVPGTRSVAAASATDRVRNWQNIWDETYRHASEAGAVDPRFRIAGWNDSYTGEPIPAPEMREWLDATVARILALAPRRVLEIGCGTGLILYRTAPAVDHYTGVDVSPEALRSIQAELTPAEAAKVTLLQRAAHELTDLTERSFDLVIINSVAQYFPDAGYLTQVLRRATDLVADGGRIFVGDIRSLAHLTAFHASIELRQAPPAAVAEELQARIDQRVAREGELLLAESFFHALAQDTPRVSGVEVELKRGAAQNELVAFRYDVILRVGDKAASKPAPAMPASVPVAGLNDVRNQLRTEPPLLVLRDVPNARLAGVAATLRDLSPGSGVTNAEGLRAVMAAEADRGIDPESLYTVDPRYDVRIRWAGSGNAAHFDAVLRHKTQGPRDWPEWPPRSDTGTTTGHANTPAAGGNQDGMIAEIRTALQSSLPSYMVPSAFVVLNEMPLTPNGKIDRKALPEPERQAARAVTAYAPPSNVLEQQIAGIWQELLNVERVGRLDNIFDLRANSLLTMQANNRLAALLGRKISLVSMFRYPTIASLAAHLDEGAGSEAAANEEQRTKERASRAEQAAERRRALRAERGGR